ncbi:LOW QUALITY PROTEIN: calreticulin-3 [Chlamydotis macqueenii]
MAAAGPEGRAGGEPRPPRSGGPCSSGPRWALPGPGCVSRSGLWVEQTGRAGGLIQSASRTGGRLNSLQGAFIHTGDPVRGRGLQTSENSKFVLSSRFKPPSDEVKLVILYIVKHEQEIECSEGYVKVFSSNLDQKSGDSHYYVMFDETCEVKVDNKMVASGNLEDDLDLLLLGKINDPTDWDEPKCIVDTGAERPEDGDDAVNGRWCYPMVTNPLYRGEWKPRQMAYGGVWPLAQTDNPNYSPDFSIYSCENTSVIGVEIWQARAGTIFDNFLITDDEVYAEDFGDETWGQIKPSN